jgi:TnpA family transposase
MTKQNTPKAAPDRAATMKVIAGRVRLIGSRRAPATRAIYNDVAALIEKEMKKHASPTKN